MVIDSGVGGETISMTSDNQGSLGSVSSTPTKNTPRSFPRSTNAELRTLHLGRDKDTSEACQQNNCFDSASTSSSTEERPWSAHDWDAHMLQIIRETKYKYGTKFTIFEDLIFERQLIESHNQVRLSFGCAPLRWSPEIARIAHDWAINILHRGRILYPEMTGIGENIELSVASELNHLPTGTEITEKWAQEAESFCFNKPRWSTATQHFTQLIWRECKDMGAARIWDRESNKVVVVVLYKPEGNSNAPGDFASNVPRPAPGEKYGQKHSSCSQYCLVNAGQTNGNE